MCGIVGIISNEGLTSWASRKKIMEQMIIADTFRGHHSTGLFSVDKDKGGVHHFKRAIPGWDFVDLGRTQDILKDIDKRVFTIAHNRWATKGTVNNANAHPFQHAHIIGVHNGDTPKTDFKDGSRFDVDSDALFHSIATIGSKETIERISGAFTLVWYDTLLESLHIIRNSDRPMYFLQDAKTQEIYLGSEHQMIEWILERNRIYNFDVTEAKVGIEYVFPLSDPYEFHQVEHDLKTSRANAYWYGYQNYGNNRNNNNKDKKKETSRRLPSLSALKLRHKQRMKVGVIEYHPYQPKSEFGQVECMQWEEPNHLVVLHGITEEGYKALDNTIEVEITGTSFNKDGEVQLNAHIVKESAKVIALPNQSPSTKLEKNMEGPSGKVTLGRFRELVRDGCGNCSGDIDERDHEKLEWFGDAPICPECQILEEFNDSVPLH